MEALEIGRPGDVGAEAEAAVAFATRGDFAGDGLDPVGSPAAEGDRMTSFQERVDEGAAQSLRCAGDDDMLHPRVSLTEAP
jgi:hypothetical protein